MNNNETDPFGALLIIGNRITVIEEHEDGTVTREEHLWRDFWPSGTVFYDDDNVIAVKLGNLWLNWAGDAMADLRDAMNAPYRMVLDEATRDDLRDRWRRARSAMVAWRHLLATSTIPADESGE